MIGNEKLENPLQFQKQKTCSMPIIDFEGIRIGWPRFEMECILHFSLAILNSEYYDSGTC